MGDTVSNGQDPIIVSGPVQTYTFTPNFLDRFLDLPSRMVELCLSRAWVWIDLGLPHTSDAR